MHIGEYEAIRLLQENYDDSRDNISRVLEICDTYLGAGLYSKERLKEICQNERHYFYMIMEKNTMCGIFYCYGDNIKNISFLKDVRIPGIDADAYIGIGQSIAFCEEMRSTGVAEQILKYCTELLFEREGAVAVLVPAWIKNGYIPAQRHLEKCGYRMLMELEKPWADCEGLDCPICIHSPCICNAALYIMERGENHGATETL